MMTQALLAPIYDFLHCETPALWVDVALENQAVMLIDHANCEKSGGHGDEPDDEISGSH